jgi:hypothetical protein
MRPRRRSAARFPNRVQKAKSNAWVQADPMSFLESVSMEPKNSGRVSPNRCIESLIFLAANLHDIIGQRGFGKLSVIVKELESINATHVQQPRRNRAFSR